MCRVGCLGRCAWVRAEVHLPAARVVGRALGNHLEDEGAPASLVGLQLDLVAYLHGVEEELRAQRLDLSVA